MKYEPMYCNPKNINLTDFIPPHNIVESFRNGLKIQGNVIYPEHPIYNNYAFYNWDWSINEGVGVVDSNKWQWVNEYGMPMGNSDCNYPVLNDNDKISDLTSDGDVYIEKYSPMRLWIGSNINEAVAGTPGCDKGDVNNLVRDSNLYNKSLSHDLSFYMKLGRPLLGNITSNRNPNQIEYYIKNGMIITNYDFDNSPVMRDSVIISYETITKNVKLKIVMRSNESKKSFTTPTLDNYTLNISGQASGKEVL